MQEFIPDGFTPLLSLFSGQLGLGPSTDTLSLEAVPLPVRIYFPGEDVTSLLGPDTPLAAGSGYFSPPGTPFPTTFPPYCLLIVFMLFRSTVRCTAAKLGLPKVEPPVAVTLPDVPATPKPPTPMYTSGNRSKRARQVACGSRHTIVLTVSGDVYVFGSNSEGQLGESRPKAATGYVRHCVVIVAVFFSHVLCVRSGLGDGIDTVDVPTIVPTLSHKVAFEGTVVSVPQCLHQ
jgi:Regulator of chromosome condensation (RCC1) repeat